MSGGERERRGAATRLVWVLAAIGLFGFLVVPWYAIEDGFFSIEWVPYYPMDQELAPAIIQGISFGRPWLLPVLLCLIAPLFVARRPKADARAAWVLILAGSTGLAYTLIQGFLIGPLGWSSEALEGAFGPLEGARQYGMGYGAIVVHVAFALLLAEGLARRGAIRGDSFVVGALALVLGSVIAFVFFPVAIISVRAFEAESLAANIAVSLG